MGHYLNDPGPEIPDPGCHRQNRRRLAEALGFAEALHAGEVRRTPRHAVPGGSAVLPHQGRTGRTTSKRYASAFELPVLTGVRVERLWRERRPLRRLAERPALGGRQRRRGDRKQLSAQGAGFRARTSRRPSCSSTPASTGTPGQLQDGPSLWWASATREPKSPSKVPHTPHAGRRQARRRNAGRHGRTAARFVLPVVRFLGLHVLTLDTPIGRKAAPHMLAHAAPLIRTKSQGPRRRRRPSSSRGSPVCRTGTLWWQAAPSKRCPT